VHAWMPEEAAMSVPLVRHYRELFLANRDQIQTYNAAQRRYSQVLDAWKAEHSKPRPDPPQPLSPELMTARRFHGVGVLFDRLIRPVIPYAIRGAIWYQGESDSDQPDMARAYAAQLTELIATWRRAWGQGDFPFYFVQLPCFTPGTNWPDVRQGMLEVFRSVPATGMAVMVDTGDVDNLHPDTKQEAGGRLANWALAKTYSRDVACAGPVFRDFVIDVQRLTIRFDPLGPGLVASGGALADFEVAGRDGRYVPATASIADGAVIVSAPAVASPLAVRYGWKPAFRPTLFGANGLPASPFAASHSKD